MQAIKLEDAPGVLRVEVLRADGQRDELQVSTMHVGNILLDAGLGAGAPLDRETQGRVAETLRGYCFPAAIAQSLPAWAIFAACLQAAEHAATLGKDARP